ncbi:GLPGLI family protein [Olleya sp. UBA1516]|uniref:GLPGLI family protein n=1 Tax=Olleya sp. UBA1516 TaxID=1947013 RepID=UPI0025E7048A|nr:GLPGLI family protein [Olleya sp. UBA1516]|tara:strand:- start:34206 stop:35033 length:828 start_codon:yes stop_codon:yes gene_type:complete
MKIKILIALLFSIQLISAQNSDKTSLSDSLNNQYQIEYTVNFNTYIPLSKKGILIPYLKENKSNYYEMPFDEDNATKDEADDSEINETIVIGKKNVIKRNFTNLNTNKLSSTETITFDNSLYLVTEALPKLDWDLSHPDTLKIGTYMCNKATTSFRGRNYIAWYTNDIPITFGPWKFHGLPGLILDMYDQTHKYEWIVTKITKKTINEKILNQDKHDVNISLEAFVALREELFNTKMNNFKNNLKSRQDRGTNVSVDTFNTRQGRELLFEWEDKK